MPLPAPELLFALRSESIELAQLLKASGIASSGGEAKVLVQAGEVRVNGEVETRRGHKIKPGDVVEASGRRVRVTPPA